jgi:hypothetical protein
MDIDYTGFIKIPKSKFENYLNYFELLTDFFEYVESLI